LKTVAEIGSLVKKVHRHYSNFLIEILEQKGFSDLRPSFLEILIVIAEHDGPSLKEIGESCGLKKQTMTSHVNELVIRGYLRKEVGKKDKREQKVYFTELGERFKLNFLEAIDNLENKYQHQIGEVELLRVRSILHNFYQKISEN
jgi:DNA-binding MarR family transcriptional regulator